MKLSSRTLTALFVVLLTSAWAQQPKPAGALAAADLKVLVPANYFYRGQSASVQLRNSAGIRTKDQKYVLAGLVDASGYASDVAQKYQGRRKRSLQVVCREEVRHADARLKRLMNVAKADVCNDVQNYGFFS